MTVGRFDRPAAIINVARARSVPYVVAGVLVVLALLNLAHHLILSAPRRRRDLAVLRALGADSRWVTGVVHWQASCSRSRPWRWAHRSGSRPGASPTAPSSAASVRSTP